MNPSTQFRKERALQKAKESVMPVIAKFYGIVIRLLCLQTFGTRLHAFYGDSELVVDVARGRIISGDAPEAIRGLVLGWARQHREELLGRWELLVRQRSLLAAHAHA